MNSKQSGTQSCVWCGKSYKNKVYLEKHGILCELLHNCSKKRSNKNSSSDDVADDISDDVPCPKKMYQMLLELGYKYSKLEEKMEEVNKFVVKKKKKINVIEWLNANITPSFVFDDLIGKIKITDGDVEFLMEYSFLDTMNLVLTRFIYSNSESESESESENTSDFKPLFAFVQKNNVFYAFTSEKGWMELTKDKLVSFLMNVQMKISKAFHEWKKPRARRIQDDENFALLCDKTLMKIMANEFKSETTFNKMRVTIYNKMKTDMKALVEYEFEF